MILRLLSFFISLFFTVGLSSCGSSLPEDVLPQLEVQSGDLRTLSGLPILEPDLLLDP